MNRDTKRSEYISNYKPELIEGNGYEGRQTSKVLNNRRSYNLKVPITWSRRCTAENKMAEDSEEMFVWGDDFDPILAILEEDEAIDHHFTSVIKEVSICFCFWKFVSPTK